MTQPADYPAFDGTQACAGVNLNRFFPAHNSAETTLDRGRAVCAGCAFLTPCFTYAATNFEVGIWGGTSDADRRRWRAKHGITIPRGTRGKDSVKQRILDMHTEGMTAREIADELGITYGSAATVISRRRAEERAA